MKGRMIRAWESFWPSLIWWLPFVSFLVITDATIPTIPPAPGPPTHPILDFLDRPEVTLAILVIVAEFLLVKSGLMARTYMRLPQYQSPTGRLTNGGTIAKVYEERIKGRHDYLALSLISANVAFFALYTLSIALFVHPTWSVDHPVEVRIITNLARVGLAVVLAWGGWQLLSVPDGMGEDRITLKGIVVTALLVAQLVVVIVLVRSGIIHRFNPACVTNALKEIAKHATG